MNTQEQILKLIQDAISKAQNGNSTPTIQDTKNQNINGVQYNDSGKASEESNHYYSEILNNSNGQFGSLEELYQALGFGLSGNNMTPAQREDFLKMLIDKMIAKEELNEQRSYDSPAAQLARLLQTGMSKDAALQAIAGGSGSGSGSGSPLIGAASSPAPSESYSNEVGAKTQIANTALNALQCASSVIKTGFEIPAQVATNTIQSTAAKHAKKAQESFEAVGAATNVLKTAVDAGIISREDYDSAIRSASTLKGGIDYVASKDPNSTCAQFVSSPEYAALSSPYAADAAAEHYIRQRSGEDYAVGLAHEFIMRRAAEQLSSIDIDTASADLQGILIRNEDAILQTYIDYYRLENIMPAQLKQIIADACLKESQNELNEQELKLFGLKKRTLQSQIGLNNSMSFLNYKQGQYVGEQSRALKLNTDLFEESLGAVLFDPMEKNPLNGFKTGRQWITQGMIGSYANNALAYYGITYPQGRKYFKKTLQNSAEFNFTNSLFRCLYQTDQLNWYQGQQQNPFNVLPLIHSTNMIFNNPLTGQPTGAGTAAGLILRTVK